MSERALVVFVVGECICALPTGAVREVVHYPELAVPPGTPDILEGFLNYGGEVLPVLRLDRLFALPRAEPGLYTQVLVLRGAAGRLAVLVDAVRTVLRVDRGALMPVDGGSVFNDCLEAQIEAEGGTIHVLAPEKVLLEQERERLRQLGEMAERRLSELDCSA